MGGSHFAVTVESDGLLLDIDAQVSSQHFCYLPGGFTIEEDIAQTTHAVGYDSGTDQLIAQPQSFFSNGDNTAHIGVYSGQGGGQPTSWFNLQDDDFYAGGMVWAESGVMLGYEQVLYGYTMGEAEPRAVYDVSEYGLDRIEGLALSGGTLYVVDNDQLLILRQ